MEYILKLSELIPRIRIDWMENPSRVTNLDIIKSHLILVNYIILGTFTFEGLQI